MMMLIFDNGCNIISIDYYLPSDNYRSIHQQDAFDAPHIIGVDVFDAESALLLPSCSIAGCAAVPQVYLSLRVCASFV